MIAIDRKTTVFPQHLRPKRTNQLKLHEDALAASTPLASKDFSSGLYAHADVKDRLWKVQAAKCCFCEQKGSGSGLERGHAGLLSQGAGQACG